MTANAPVQPLNAEDADWIIDCKGLSNTQRSAFAAICDGRHKVIAVCTEAEAKEAWKRQYVIPLTPTASTFSEERTLSLNSWLAALRWAGKIEDKQS